MVKDLKKNRNMAMKLQDDQEMTLNEIGAMKKISEVFDVNKSSELSV